MKKFRAIAIAIYNNYIYDFPKTSITCAVLMIQVDTVFLHALFCSENAPRGVHWFLQMQRSRMMAGSLFVQYATLTHYVLQFVTTM